jgi:hypothetical protein
LGVIPANEYLATMGWTVVRDDDDDDGNGLSITEYRLVKVNPATSSTILRQQRNTPLSTNLSADDIVKHCYEMGVVDSPQGQTPRRINGVTASASTVAMAFAVNPPHPHPASIPIVVQEAQETGTVTDERRVVLLDQVSE